MALGSLLTLLDDIATILDDVAVMTKIAAKKTAGVLGDDLALNAQQVSGVAADRELPVVLAVAKGSFINKLILVPLALAVSYYSPWLITPLLMLGGAFLCFEGFEKITHSFLHEEENANHKTKLKQSLASPSADLINVEKDKIKGAIRTDFILSAEIIVIALGTVAEATFSQQIVVVSSIAVIMTVGVYGLVAGIVKLDDLGLYLLKIKGASAIQTLLQAVGQFLITITPYLMRILSVLGTAAMFLVGGSIIGHGLPFLHHFTESITINLQAVGGGVLTWLVPLLIDALVGLVVGAIVLMVMTAFGKIFKKR